MAKPPARTTEIEWTHSSWNPFVGCNVHSAGCTNCYAMRQAYRLEHNFAMPQYQGTTRLVNGNPIWTGVVNRASNAKMYEPKKWSPRLIFVNSMSDFFHPNAEDAWRIEALRVMQDCPQHRFQILTKRPEEIAYFAARHGLDEGTGNWFPDNVWIGATVEDARVTYRIDTLRKVRAAVRFLSCEPLIGSLEVPNLDGMDWIIVGGESGPGARRMDPNWVREIRDQCMVENRPYFFKQWGTPGNNPLFTNPQPGFTGAVWLKMNDPIGKGGSLIDGKFWKQWPRCYNPDLFGE
jgi:protein gp37